MARFNPHPDRRAAVVTGASSGLGHATAQALADAGHPVVLGARRLDRTEELAAKIRAGGGEALALPLDLCDGDSVDAFARRAEAEMGPIEVVISNAGEVRPLSTVETDPDDFLRQAQINLLGAQRLVHRLGPHMLGRHRGDIVFVTSEVAQHPRPLMAAYVASKSGLEGMARAMQMELEGSGVRVSIVRPGPSATEQGTTWSEDEVNRVVASWTAWGVLRHGGYLRPGDVARTITWLVSVPRGTHIPCLDIEPEAPITPHVDSEEDR